MIYHNNIANTFNWSLISTQWLIYFSAIESSLDANQEPSPDIGTIVYYILISIPVMFTIFGLIYMCRTNCEVRKNCCKCCVDIEKKDVNLDYGTYYDVEGERRLDVMEVSYEIINWMLHQQGCLWQRLTLNIQNYTILCLQARDENPEYYTTSWATVMAELSTGTLTTATAEMCLVSSWLIPNKFTPNWMIKWLKNVFFSGKEFVFLVLATKTHGHGDS